MLTFIAYAVGIVFALGFSFKIIKWLSSPNPLNIPTQPAPVDKGGTVFRILGEVLFFTSLFKADKPLWFGGYIFHVSFLIIVLRHLRYFVYPVPSWIVALEPVGIFAGFTLVLSLGYLIIRRVTNDRVLYISSFMDYAVLFLILLIGITGLTMQFVHRPDLVAVKAYLLGLISFRPTESPDSVMFLIHFGLFLLLLLYFPFSKLMHAPGVFISPTRSLADNPREKRHVNPWAEKA
jgi:nitrate reductase gamma subunit